MRPVRAWLLRLGALFRRRQREHELIEELTDHLQRHIADNVRAGLLPDEARRQAPE